MLSASGALSRPQLRVWRRWRRVPACSRSSSFPIGCVVLGRHPWQPISPAPPARRMRRGGDCEGDRPSGSGVRSAHLGPLLLRPRKRRRCGSCRAAHRPRRGGCCFCRCWRQRWRQGYPTAASERQLIDRAGRRGCSGAGHPLRGSAAVRCRSHGDVRGRPGLVQPPHSALCGGDVEAAPRPAVQWGWRRACGRHRRRVRKSSRGGGGGGSRQGPSGRRRRFTSAGTSASAPVGGQGRR